MNLADKRWLNTLRKRAIPNGWVMRRIRNTNGEELVIPMSPAEAKRMALLCFQNCASHSQLIFGAKRKNGNRVDLNSTEK